jgi:hypothetical protein
LEDTAVTLADLRQEGFSEDVLAAVNLITHDKRTLPYRVYVQRIATDLVAR